MLNYQRIKVDTEYNFYFDDNYYLLPNPTKEQTGTFPPRNATRNVPFQLPEKYINHYNIETKDWEAVEDHRQKIDERGRIIENSGTPYWLSEDIWTSAPRYMETPGNLPIEASLTKPEKPLDAYRTEKLQEIKNALATEETSGYASTSLGFDINATRKAEEDIQRLITKMETEKITSTQFRDFKNEYHEISLNDVYTLKQICSDKIQFNYQHKWQLEIAITNATTVEEISIIKW